MRVTRAQIIEYIVQELKNDSDFAGIPDTRLALAVDRALTQHITKELDDLQAVCTVGLCRCLLDLCKLNLQD